MNMKENIYKKFASAYDGIYDDNFYNGYYFFIKKIVKENNISQVNLLDLACGTGRLLQKLKPICHIIEGVDSSAEMLKVAKFKDRKIKYYQQDFLNLNLKNEYNVIISTFDSVNYLKTKADLMVAFKNVCRHLAKGGIFVFDFNTIYKKPKKEIKKGGIFFRSLIKGRYWLINIILKKDDKIIFQERHKERLYSFAEIASALKASGLEIISIYSDFSREIRKPVKEPRLFLLAKK